ncbi:LuxR C-terminal-related transcriptional regulator [Edwardsiella piscicida]|uniref:LuxR C-terminal-related transcriptional regulator n=1 Tax=Edwardsiella piscicida TaxID=1263550 RepID=UPI00093380B2|nr:LuxR C-terminal-related transcriptional regulator [Edwardsiella piscicida]EKS7813030.1 helix-turn-helix transcriptional regulator [Edwardsiella piscicida]WAM43441.1 LuxR C-terminal-related transcriptional regulator [Edwardsiella piscicida]
MMAISHDVFKEKNGLSLITQPTLQSMLLVDVLNNYLSVPIYLCDAPRNSTYLLDDCALIIFDAMLLDGDPAQRSSWLEAIFNQRVGRRIILINVNTHDEGLAWHQHGNIIAAFPAKTHQQALIRRLRTLLVAAQEDEPGEAIPVPRLTRLTLRELEVLKAMQQGASNLDISRILYISENTVRTHIYNIFKKIAVKNRIQAVKWADTHLCG